MKATLQFNLPEERFEFEEAQRAADYRSVLVGVAKYLRDHVKYADEPPERKAVFEEIYQEFNQACIELGVDITC